MLLEKRLPAVAREVEQSEAQMNSWLLSLQDTVIERILGGKV